MISLILMEIVALANTSQGFYDAVNDKLIEPDLPGISYSFTADGHYEEAYYRAIANRKSSLHCCLSFPDDLTLWDGQPRTLRVRKGSCSGSMAPSS